MAFTSWFPNSINPRLVPPTWALTVEIFFYILICIGISKTFFRVKVWLFLSLCYVVGSFFIGLDWEARYFPVAAASLPFSIGAAIYFSSKSESLMQLFVKLRMSSTFLFVVMLLNCLTWMLISRMKVGNLVEIGFYINIVICALLVFGLAKGSEITNINRQTDKVIGDYSYPIYLLHWQSGLLASYLIFGEAFHEFSSRGFITLIAAFVIVVLFSTLFIRGIDERVQRLRAKIKANNALHRTLVPRAAEL
jgi:peptidoglycan/LPS O-acetylase OafA/YrhL